MAIGTRDGGDLAKPVLATAPAATDPAAEPPARTRRSHDVNHYQCWDARQTKDTPSLPKDIAVTVGDAFGAPRTYTVKRLRRVCTPAQADGADVERAAASLACFRVRRARDEPRPAPARGLRVHDDVAAQILDLTREDMLCLPAVLDDGRCNGGAELCERRFDEVAYRDDAQRDVERGRGLARAEPAAGIWRQMEDGVRGLMLDTRRWRRRKLCHGNCDLGGEPLASGLRKIRRYLDLHPQRGGEHRLRGLRPRDRHRRRIRRAPV